MITPDISSSTKSARKNRFLWMNRSEYLEEYKEKEFTERWSYELAKLYYQMEILRSV